ncbi:MAG: SDR family oxidoreductase [Deltaproteobacteria bacterium]|nr:SDR family oxidoreductase [Deltaproteobacteria bacterium]MBW2051901.1 SDR family oxidoreductase [Deltaproteobacteria bacterium]MBW2141883.1 SDR family oxidoreductase [Deltaproteobacteria bacterium]MBW2323298.1 SDR family oxidoreductase [Deltaproteobacteria bacterium]
MDVSQFCLEGKVALITGGSRGIGEVTAIGFAKAGADVVVASRKLPGLETVAGAVTDIGRKALAVEAHIGRMDQIRNLVEKVVAEFGRIDILVNNAGTSIAASAMDIEEKAWDAVMNLNLKGLFFLSQAAARIMKNNGGGKIINVASIDGYEAQPETCVYSVAKTAVRMATKVMAKEWAQYNIRVNAIAPGYIETHLLNAKWWDLSDEETKEAKAEMAEGIPLGRIGDPVEIANAMIYLASDASSYVTGQTFLVDGGVLL